jgi:molybdate transport system ATP-binding protein
MSALAIDLRGRIGELELDVRFESSAVVTAFVGPNGAGKSTLLRMLAGAPLSIEGTVTIAGVTIVDTSRGLVMPPGERRVGYLPQSLALFPHLSVLDNVSFGCRDHVKARAVLERVGCAALEARRPAQLSGGEAQRVALARALAADPHALLLDEPLAALDVAHRRAMRAFLGELLTERGRPALLVTHDARDLRALAGYVVVLERGRVVQAGTLAELARAPATDFVAELLAPV